MSEMEQRVILSYISKRSNREFNMPKLFEITKELTELRKSLENNWVNYYGTGERLDPKDRSESEKEREDLEGRIEKKMDEYAHLMHQMYPKTPLKECYPPKIKKDEYPKIFMNSKNPKI